MREISQSKQRVRLLRSEQDTAVVGTRFSTDMCLPLSTWRNLPTHCDHSSSVVVSQWLTFAVGQGFTASSSSTPTTSGASSRTVKAAIPSHFSTLGLTPPTTLLTQTTVKTPGNNGGDGQENNGLTDRCKCAPWATETGQDHHRDWTQLVLRSGGVQKWSRR